MVDVEAFSPDSAQVQNPKSVTTNNINSVLMIGAAAFIPIMILLIGGWFCFCFKRKLSAKGAGKLNASEMNLRGFHFEEVQKATNNFSPDCLIGSGAFSNVYLGTFDVVGPLAVKRPHNESYTTTEEEEFRNEVRLLSKVKHNNLVGLVGFCEEIGTKGAKILVYEYVPNGSLLDYIMGRGDKNLTWKQRVRIAIGAAKGIAHLHEGVNPSIIHRDIKPSNILIGEGLEAKVSDFGLVRAGPVGDQSHVSSLVKGTPGYLDPAYCSRLHLTPFTDVYSFGVILFQLVAARPVFESTKANSNSHIIDWARPSIENGRIEEILDVNLVMEGCNMDVMLEMGRLALKCVVDEPKKRPTMSRIWRKLEAMLECSSPKQPVRMDFPRSNTRFSRSINRASMNDTDFSQSMVSIDGIGLQRFHVDMESVSFQSVNLRCLETSISMGEDFSKS